MNPTILDRLVLPLRRCGDLAGFTSLSLSPPSVQDLERLGQVAWEDNRPLQDVRPLVLNPEFRLSRDLGGADADLIAEGRLIEWKATTTAGIVGRPQLWQLVGYLLADTADEYAIREVSISALRWRSTVTWPIDLLLAELAPGPPAGLTTLKGERVGTPVDIESLRADFAQVVRRTAQRAPAGIRGRGGSA
jgi:hypothetical protein